MDAVTTTNSVDLAQTPVVPVQEAEETSSSVLASDFETFLRLLTTQLQNQDPSKPLDSTEFVAQLASFSAVEQQINTNTKLDQLINQVNSSTASDLSKWIGAEVKSDAPARFEGEPIDVFYTVPQSASSVQLVVLNGNGSEVDRRTVDLASKEFTWDGIDSSLNKLPDGDYRFKIEGFENAQSMGLQAAQSFSVVKETRQTGGAIELMFSDGSKIAATDVTAVRGAD